MTASLSMRAALQQVAAGASAVLFLHAEGDFRDSWDSRRQCTGCRYYHPCPSYEHADRIRVTALAQINALNEADCVPINAAGDDESWARLVPDPKESE